MVCAPGWSACTVAQLIKPVQARPRLHRAPVCPLLLLCCLLLHCLHVQDDARDASRVDTLAHM